MKKGVVIVGGSAGAIIAQEIFSTQYEDIRFLETYSDKIDKKLVISDSIIKGMRFISEKQYDYFIATGDNYQREKNFKLIYSEIRRRPVNCIHETAYISRSSKIGYGNLICPNSIIHTYAKVGNNTIINTGSIVEHDCQIGDYAQISPNVTLCGYVSVGKFAFIGAASVVIPKIKIGKHVMIAAGASVIEDVNGRKMFAGVPAKYKKDL